MNIHDHALSLSTNIKYFQSRGLPALDQYSQLLYLIIYEYNHDINPDLYPQIPSCIPDIQERVRVIINNGREPDFDLGPFWYYAPICQSFALLKKKSRLWELFSRIEHEKITQLMKMYAYNWNLGCNTENNYGTGVSLTGNYGKWRGPNYRLANIGLIFPIVSFFKSIDNLNALFLNYDYNTEINNLIKYNFTNVLKTWSTQTYYSNDKKKILGARDLTMDGGTAYIQETKNGLTNTYWRGTGKGVRIPYAFKDNYPYGIIHFLYNNCFSGGQCISSVQTTSSDNFIAHISDNSVSPYEGLDGLMLEFNMEDDGLGTRSSLFYCTVDFLLIINLCETLDKLNISRLINYRNFDKVKNGMNDYIYKKEHGYEGYRLGHKEIFTSDNLKGLDAWIDYWKVNYQDLQSKKENIDG